MSSSEKVPKAMEEKFAAIAALTDAFCAQHLNEEYRLVIRRLLAALSRKRPSPLVRGSEAVWAAAAVHAIGFVNFLGDSSQTPHCKPPIIYGFFGIGESSGQNKSKEIRKLLDMGQFSPEWTLPSKLAGNPLVWLIEVNGIMVDARHTSLEIQRIAYTKGLIPYVPADRQSEP